MAKQNLVVDDYPILRRRVEQELALGVNEARQRLTVSYRRIGKYIHDHLLKHQDRAGYGEGVIKKLSRDTNIATNTLWQSVKFYREYPKLHAREVLSWTHYRVLLTVENKVKRQALADRAKKKKMNSRELEQEVKKHHRKDAVSKGDSPRLPVEKGQLYLYKVLGSNQGRVVLDCGFYISREISSSKRFAEGQIIGSVKEKGIYTLRASAATKKKCYTFLAEVVRVVDGDTLWVNVDCGFRTKVRQKLRLREIDCPELSTAAGLKAKKYVQKLLRKGSQVRIKTYGSDKYDRYLVDVFVGEGEQFLNQVLLDRGMARAY